MSCTRKGGERCYSAATVASLCTEGEEFKSLNAVAKETESNGISPGCGEKRVFPRGGEEPNEHHLP